MPVAPQAGEQRQGQHLQADAEQDPTRVMQCAGEVGPGQVEAHGHHNAGQHPGKYDLRQSLC